MPDFSYTPKQINDKSMLSPGWHPAFLVAIADEETPASWSMAAKSPRLWRWQFAVWETPAHIAQAVPEMQSVPSAQKFTPGGGKLPNGTPVSPSKAYVFTRKLLARPIEAGEHINLESMMPFPCQVLVSRTNKNGEPIDWANLTDLQAWPDGAAYLTAEVRANLASWLQSKTDGPSTEPPAAPVRQPTPPATPPPVAQPAWNTPPAAQHPGTAPKAGW